MDVDEWKEIYFDDHDVELTTKDLAYRRMSDAIKNYKYQSKKKRREPIDLEKQAAMKATAGLAFAPLQKRLAALEVECKHLREERDK